MMTTIDRLILRLPPEFAGRERALGHAIAEALAAAPPRAGRIDHLAASFAGISPLARDGDIARDVASRVHSQIKAGD